MSKKRVLFIANHRMGRSPGQRFRFEQYLDFLAENGYECDFSPIISEDDDKILYLNGKLLGKASIALKARNTRSQDVKNANQYDIIFIYREALLTRSVRFERLFAKSKAKIIFDFDDAIWLPNVSSGNRYLKFLKDPSKTSLILQFADMVFAGNSYLAAYAKKYCDSVKVIPTTIDTDYHKRSKKKSDDSKICIGWTGTQTTLKYLDQLKGVFKSLTKQYGDRIYFKIICDRIWKCEGIELKNDSWQKEREIEQLEEIDIGLMPLTDDDWSKGKCGFKALQYMALETATVLSPVGVNKEIVEDGVNGFFANSESDWLRTLSLLIENSTLRNKLGREGRKTIEERFSVKAYRQVYLDCFNELLNKKTVVK